MINTHLYKRVYACGPTTISLGSRTLIMGILNVTPDSFSDGGRYQNVEQAVSHAIRLIQEGADFVDIGGESTRPGALKITLDEELERVIPVIKAIHREAPYIPLSIDTYKAKVAYEALVAGAHLINDVGGCYVDPEMARVAARFRCPLLLMHNCVERDPSIPLITSVIERLRQSIKIALNAGVNRELIMVDPGIGFAKNEKENLILMTRLQQLHTLGCPIVLGTSKKRFIRTSLNVSIEDTNEGTAATLAFGIAQGCQIVRVHDVRALRRTVQMCDAMLYASPQ